MMPPKKDKDKPVLSAGMFRKHSDNEDSDSEQPHNERFIERMIKAFSVSFELCVDRLITSLEHRLSQRLDIHETSLFDVNKRIDGLDKQCRKLEQENAGLHDSLAVLTTKCGKLEIVCDDLEQRSRSCNLLLHGRSVEDDEMEGGKLTQRVLTTFSSSLGLSVQSGDVGVVHRTRRSDVSRGSSQSKPPPVVIQFNNRATRNLVLENRKKLKRTGVSITEQLTARRMALLKTASDLVTAQKLQSSWSHDGRILVKSADNRTVIVHSASDLAPFQ